MMLSLKSPDVSERLKRKLLRLKEAKERYFYNMPTEFGSRKRYWKRKQEFPKRLSKKGWRNYQ
ncbi:MAG: hypothetical protein N2V75_10585 [Methanophagales archaeon]|nr:hypothetical protein [Methanophagales archaeon]